MMINGINVKNIPEYAKKHYYIIARIHYTPKKKEYWFHGAYDDIEKTIEITNAIDGIIVCG